MTEQNPYSAPQTELGAPSSGSTIEVTPFALGEFGRMWIWAVVYSGLALATYALGMVSFMRYARTQSTAYIKWFAVEHIVGIVIMGTVGLIAFTRLRAERKATLELKGLVLLFQLSFGRIIISLVAMLAPWFIAIFGAVSAAPLGSPAPVSFDDALAEMRLWMRMITGAFVVALIQQAGSVISLSRYGGLHYALPGLAFIAARVANILFMVLALRATADYVRSRRSSDFDLLAIALRKMMQVQALGAIVAEGTQLLAPLFR